VTNNIGSVWLENRRGSTALGIDEAAPRISFISSEPSAGYEIKFSGPDGATTHAVVTRTRLVEWPFPPLDPRAGGTLSVRGIGEDEWSEPIRVERGIADDWHADFVSPSPFAAEGELRAAYLLRSMFNTQEVGVELKDVARARIYSTAHGLYELETNGAPVATDRLAPGWSSYRHRLRYQSYDILHLLRDGDNVVGAWLGDGWYRGHFGFDGGLWNIYGTDVALLLQLELTTRSGRLVRVPLEWSWHASPITAVGLYEGETYDARLLPAGWSEPGFDASRWTSADIIERSNFSGRIEAPTASPVRVTETLLPVAVDRPPNGRIRIDFGQNISGVLRIRPRGVRGHQLKLHHAEVIEDGELGTRPLRAATSVDTYVCSGISGEEYSPRFTVHGFQFVELENWPGDLHDGDIEALAIHTEMERTGWFDSSHDGLNKLHANVLWSMRDNFVDIPTDCPQRDERMGWTGDIQVFAPTALRLFAAHGTLTGWLRDLAAEQAEAGFVPQFVPWVGCGFPNFPTAAWGDAAVIVPWEMYLNDGDTRILEQQYPSMKAWVDLVDDLTGHTGLWNTGFQLGDWLDPEAPPDSPGDSHTDRYLVATAYHAKTARILAKTAELTGRVEDASHYRAIAERATRAFQSEFISPSGRVVSDTATSISIALVFDLFATTKQAKRAGQRLRHLVESAGFHISTGFVGTPIICDALVLAGSLDYAYHLLLQEELPSWLYPVSMGATTIWERWDSMLPDGSINPGEMTSFNHYALGAVADFLHRSVAGLEPDAPGWSRIRFAPKPGGGLAHASARYNSGLGVAASAWRRDGPILTIDVTVPVGAIGIVVLPDTGEELIVGPGDHSIETSFRPIDEDPAAPTFGWRSEAAA
jgi:alpha-L-rhamnosidase